MGYEIDFLPVGDGSRSGDAILMRWGNLFGSRDQQTVVAVDGGFDDNAEQIAKHMSDYYHTDWLNLAVSTHPDADHVNGLRGVLDLVKVNQLWMHRPWNHVDSPSEKRRLRESLTSASDLEQKATSARIPIVEPFAGTSLQLNAGSLSVFGPTTSYYQDLLPEFDTSGDKAVSSQAPVYENWHLETLDDKGETTAENNSSAVLGLTCHTHKLLLTADAGIPALSHAADRLPLGWLQNLTFIQVPHHGSKRNVGPTILDRMLGPIVTEGTVRGTAFVSCAPDGLPKHPNKRVTNAFLRRGYPVSKTAGSKILYRHDAPVRHGWGPVTKLPLYYWTDD